jgi:hypothetical protein
MATWIIPAKQFPIHYRGILIYYQILTDSIQSLSPEQCNKELGLAWRATNSEKSIKMVDSFSRSFKAAASRARWV